MVGLLKKILRVDSKEIFPLLWTILFGVFIGVSVSLYDLASVVNFLQIYDSSYLPGAIICSGLLSIFFSNSFISIQNWVSYTRVAILGLGVLLCCAFLFAVKGIRSESVSAYAGFILTGPVTSLALLVFWGLFDKFFDLAQGRRLSMGAEGGIVVSSVSVLSFVAIANNAYIKEPNHLYIISFYSLIGALIVLLAVSYKFSFLRKVVINVQYIKAYNNYGKLIRQPYILLLALFSVFSGMAFYLTDYVYLAFVRDQYPAPLDTINFLAGFSASVVALGFVLQIFLVQWVHRKYGYKVSLLVLPVLLGLFTGIYGILGSIEGYDKEKSIFFFLFMLVCISRILSVSLFRSLEISTFKLFFMPLDNLLRADVQSKIERVVREVGKVVSGLLLLVLSWYSGIPYLPYVILAIIGVWGYVAVKSNAAYREKLLITLDKPEEIKKKERVTVGISGELKKRIKVSGEKEAELYLSLLKILDPAEYKECILELLESDNEEIQRLALLETSELCILPALPVLDRIIESKYYPVLKTRDIIDRVYAQLKAAEFRLEKLKYIEQLTLSKLKRERVFGALLAAYSDDSMKPRLLTKLFRDPDSKVRYSAVVSSARSSSVEIQKNLIEKLGDTYYSNAALSALTATGESAFGAMENSFYLTGQEENIQLRIVQSYGRTGSEEAVQLLLKKLNYSNQNVGRAAFRAVSDCGFNITGDRALHFKAELEEYVGVLVWNMSVYLDLEYLKASQILLQALTSEIESNYVSIFKLLSLLYDPKTIALIEENIFSNDPEKSEYAFGLLEVTVADEIKPFLLPVLTNASYDEKVVQMQAFFPTEPLSKIDALYDLIQRDYKYVNRWTKACALKELSEQKEEIDTDIFIANVINPDPLLKETAAVALYLKAVDLYPDTFERFRRELGSGFSKELASKITNALEPVEQELLLGEGSDLNAVIAAKGKKITTDYFTAPNLRFEIIKFLKSVKEFQHVPGIILMELAKNTEFQQYKEGDTIAVYESPEAMDYYIVRKGKVNLSKEGMTVGIYDEGGFIHNYLLLTNYNEKVTISASGECEVYKIRQEEFNEVMSYNEEIPWSIIKSLKVYARESARVLAVQD